MTPKIVVYSFSLPGIAFGEECVPLLSLIKHPLEVKMGSIPGSDENPFTIRLKPVYRADLDGENRIVVSPVNGDSIRDSLYVDKVFISYRKYVPQTSQTRLIKYEIELLNDTNTLKIVTKQVFLEVYKLITGQEVELDDNGNFDPTGENIIRFVIAHKFTTPDMIKIWNRNDDLKKYLPLKVWISDSDS